MKTIESTDLSNPLLYQTDDWVEVFENIRRDDPIHYCDDSPYGPYWSITRFDDIVEVEVDYKRFSAEIGGNRLENAPPGKHRPTFLRMDPPRHTAQRKTVAPIAARSNLDHYATAIEQRTRKVVDSLVYGEPFDWVEHVSTELTNMMLVTLFDFPWEDRQLLTYWSEVVVADINDANSPVRSEDERFAELKKMGEYFLALWRQRQAQTPAPDLLSVMAHSSAFADMPEAEFIGNIGMLIVAASDTTRNTMNGGARFVCDYPAEWEKVAARPEMLPSFVSETVRYQTPIIYFRRTATADLNFHGKKIRQGDKVVMWYVSGNRDETAFDSPNKFIADRTNHRRHLGFGAGIHRCIGDGLANLQLMALWQEVLRRGLTLQLAGAPERTYSNFIRGYRSLPMVIS